MVIVLNPAAGGMNAVTKWDRIRRQFESAQVHLMNNVTQTRGLVADALLRGERTFIAGGGDGTVNTLLNILLAITPAEILRSIRLGALGLGSSNDFHKPFGTLIGGIPVAIDDKHASPRDVGFVSAKTIGGIQTKYFLVNASIGIAADANHFFNQSTGMMGFLKSRSTPLAISYAAIRSILGYNEIELDIADATGESRHVTTTQFSILKNHHFSGSLRWGGETQYDNGKLSLRLAPSMNLFGRLRLMHRCGNGTADNMPGVQSWSTAACIVSSQTPFAVEFDGEILNTTIAQFGVLPRHLFVCGS